MNRMNHIQWRVNTRSDLCIQSNEFWHSVTTGGNIVSQYYQRGLSDNGDYMLEPCTAVVGSRVILCIELYYNRSNHIVYRDIMTSIYATLGEVIADFNSFQGFEADVSYTFTTHTEEEGLRVQHNSVCLVIKGQKQATHMSCIFCSSQASAHVLVVVGRC